MYSTVMPTGYTGSAHDAGLECMMNLTWTNKQQPTRKESHNDTHITSSEVQPTRSTHGHLTRVQINCNTALSAQMKAVLNC